VTGDLVITRGLPASGKTTWAREWVAQDPTRLRVNRDDLRLMTTGRLVMPGRLEDTITVAQHAAVEALLRAGHGVVVDDTNLRLRHARAWAELAERAGARFGVREFTDVPLEVCLARDAARAAAGERAVGEALIRDLHDRFLAHGPLPPVLVPDPTRPPAWIVDGDGTLALLGRRSPYAWHRVGEDAPNPPVVELVRALRAAGNAVVVVSGRDGVARAATLAWLDRHEIPHDVLLLRPRGDTRRDSVVKREIFDRSIRHVWQVRGVLDDRDQVVRMWRGLGLTCAQVAPGDF
jgi:predicted kinase